MNASMICSIRTIHSIRSIRSTCLPVTAMLILLATACPAPPSVDAGVTVKASAAGAAGAAGDAGVGGPDKSARPPHPNMATAAWGQQVLEQRVAAAGAAATASPGTAAKVSDVVDAIHEMTPAATKRAADLAALAFKSARTDVDRGTAAALLGAALVLDPTVDGYKERITDAHGLAGYAGKLDAGDAVGQAARAVVLAAAGSGAQAARLVEVVSTTPNVSADARLLIALARRLNGDWGDATLEDLQAAVAARATSGRARAALAEMYLDLGLHKEAAQTASIAGGTGAGGEATPQPWLDAIKGRALVLDGKLDEGLALLQGAEPKLDEGNRGDALYWLGRSLTSKEGTPIAQIEAIASTLSARPGFEKEGVVLHALLAQRAGDYARAKETLAPIVRGQPMLPVDGDAAWLLVDACAGLGDLRCVDEIGARGKAIDGDEARYQQARAATVLVGKAESGDKSDTGALGPLREAHRASPFDAKLAEKVGDPFVEGGPQAASRVRAARKALVRKATRIVDIALAPIVKDAKSQAARTCRVCRALDARAAGTGPDAALKAAKALAGGKEAGPPLAEADMISVVEKLGAAPVKESIAALEALAKTESRGAVLAAMEKAKAALNTKGADAVAPKGGAH